MKKYSGFSLVELMVGLVIFSIVAMAAIQGGGHLRWLHQKDADSAFATLKCAQMLDEIRSEASRQGADGSLGAFSNIAPTVLTSYLEVFDDRSQRTTWLSALSRRDISNSRINPGIQVESPPSGNIGSRFESEIRVRPVPDNKQARMVTVQVWRRQDGVLLAESVGIVGVESPTEPPRQWYAPILIQGEGVPFMEDSLNANGYHGLPWQRSSGSISRLPSSEPGGAFMVSNLGLGRDRYYVPESNANSDGWVYLNGAYTTILARYTSTAHYGYNWPSASQHNHALRYPRELAVFKDQLKWVTGKHWEVITSINGNNFCPTLQILLQSMVDRDPEYTKPLLVLGTPEVLPIPPLRNYSDAAKDPTNLPDRRVVVHPENLEYAPGAPVSLRVYTYAMNPSHHTEAETISDVTVLIKANVLPGALAVRRLVGDSTTGYSWANGTSGVDFVAVSTNVGGVPSLKVLLKNSPVRVPYHSGSGTGLPDSHRLMGLEYIPCVVGTAGTPFVFGEGVKDLTSSGPFSKNTARWVLTIPGLASGEYTIETRLGDQLATGAYSAKTVNVLIDNLAVENYSDTYFWVGIQAPFVERYQFLGDPRHMPYADVKARHGYNRYFTAVPAGDYEGFTDTAQGWSWSASNPNPSWVNSGRLNSDVPRYMQLWREALLNSNGILVTGSSWKTGRFANFLSLGGEAYTRDFDDAKRKGLPWNPNSAATIRVSELTDPKRRDASLPDFDQAYQRVIAKSDNSWVSLPWLGELFPDNQEAGWHTRGNLPTGPAGFYRARYSVFASTFGMTPGTEFVSQASGGAAALLFNGNTAGNSGNTFLQTERYTLSGTGRPVAPEPVLTPEGRILVKKIPLPMIEPVGTTFDLDGNPAFRPDGYDRVELSLSRTRTSLREAWLRDSVNRPVMGLVRLDDPFDPTRSAHVVLDGTLRRSSTGGLTDDTVRLAAQYTWAHLRAGESDLPVARRTQPAPTITLTSPEAKTYENPNIIPISYTISWKSPDGTPYTDAYPDGYASAEPIVVNGYRLDNSDGHNMWYRLYAVNGVGWPSLGNNGNYVPWPTGHIPSGFSWNVSSLPTGAYVLVLYAFPTGSAHNPSYGYHRVQFSIER